MNGSKSDEGVCRNNYIKFNNFPGEGQFITISRDRYGQSISLEFWSKFKLAKKTPPASSSESESPARVQIQAPPYLNLNLSSFSELLFRVCQIVLTVSNPGNVPV